MARVYPSGQIMKHIIFCLIILLVVAAPIAARTVEMTLHATKVSEPAKQYTLLPKVDEQTDTDAAPLYEKALQSFPNDLPMEEVNRWLKTPPDELPFNQVRSVLQQLEPILKLHEQAAKCKQCYWPYWDEDELTENSRKHRRLVFFHALKARLLIAQCQYDDAIDTAQTGFAMAKHLGNGSELIHGLFGIGVAAYMCRQLEAFVQRPGAPNLYQALRDLPQPFIDLTEQAEWIEPDTKKTVHSLMNRLDRHLAVLQCLEAMRLYSASHEGKFPKQLSDITRVPVPNDPVTGRPFIYSRTGAKAVLEIPATGEETDRDTMRYELNLKE